MFALKRKRFELFLKVSKLLLYNSNHFNMKTQVREKMSYQGQPVYVGLDVHKKTWKVAACTLHTNPGPWTVTIEKPFVKRLKEHLDKHYPGADILCGYEAGYCGYWIHDELTALGLKTRVLHPADIPTTDKERDQKEDRSDARKIAKALKNGDVRGVYVPCVQAQWDRSMVRERYSVVKSSRRIKVQIKSHLALYGIEIPEEMEKRHWSRNFVAWLEKIRDERQDGTLELQLERLDLMRNLQLKADKGIRRLCREERNKEVVEVLISIPGIGTLTAMLLLTEIVDMKRFSSFRRLCSYTGFIPTKYSSADKEAPGTITNRRNKHLRTALIESSWVAIKYDSELMMKYEEYRKRMTGQKAIVRIARILLRRIRYVWMNMQPYKKAFA
jgi:transposase